MPGPRRIRDNETGEVFDMPWEGPNPPTHEDIQLYQYQQANRPWYERAWDSVSDTAGQVGDWAARNMRPVEDLASAGKGVLNFGLGMGKMLVTPPAQQALELSNQYAINKGAEMAMDIPHPPAPPDRPRMFGGTGRPARQPVIDAPSPEWEAVKGMSPLPVDPMLNIAKGIGYAAHADEWMPGLQDLTPPSPSQFAESVGEVAPLAVMIGATKARGPEPFKPELSAEPYGPQQYEGPMPLEKPVAPVDPMAGLLETPPDITPPGPIDPATLPMTPRKGMAAPEGLAGLAERAKAAVAEREGGPLPETAFEKYMKARDKPPDVGTLEDLADPTAPVGPEAQATVLGKPMLSTQMPYEAWHESVKQMGFDDSNIALAKKIADAYGEDITRSDDLYDFDHYMTDKYGDPYIKMTEDLVERGIEPKSQVKGPKAGRIGSIGPEVDMTGESATPATDAALAKELKGPVAQLQEALKKKGAVEEPVGREPSVETLPKSKKAQAAALEDEMTALGPETMQDALRNPDTLASIAERSGVRADRVKATLLRLLTEETGAVTLPTKQQLKTAGLKAFDVFNQARMTSMLSGLAVPKSLAGDLGAHFTAALEGKSLEPIKVLANVRAIAQDIRTGWSSGHNPAMMGGFGKMNVPGRIMGAFDHAATESLKRAGLTEKQAQEILLTNSNAISSWEPLQGRAGKYVVPFRTTPFNQFGQGLVRWKKHPNVYAGAAVLGAIVGSQVKDKEALAVLSAFAGPYAMPFLMGASLSHGKKALDTLSPIPEWGITQNLTAPFKPFQDPTGRRWLRSNMGFGSKAQRERATEAPLIGKKAKPRRKTGVVGLPKLKKLGD